MAVTSYSTWQYWNDTGTSSTVTSTTDGTWNYWISDGTTTAAATDSATNDTVWMTWTSEISDEYTIIRPNSIIEFEPTGPVDQVAIARRNNQAFIDQEWPQYEREQAELTAQDLLEDLLDDNQLEIYRKTGRVLVKGRKHDYIIRKHGTTIKRLDKDTVVDLCCHLSYAHKQKMPETDNTIAKLLAIKYNEKEFNRLANQSNRRHMKDLPEAAKAA